MYNKNGDQGNGAYVSGSLLTHTSPKRTVVVRIGESAMAFVPIPNGVEAIIRGTLDGENCVQTFGFTYDGDFGNSEMEDLAGAVDIVWGAFVDTYLGSQYEYVETVVRDMRTAIATQVTDNASATAGGNTTGTSLPNNVAIAVARRSNFTGRSARGRVFVPVTISSNLVDLNHISSGFAAAVVGMFEAIDIAAGLVDWTDVVVSRVQAGIPLTSALTYTVVEWLVVDTVLDSMRRRLPGRGQ